MNDTGLKKQVKRHWKRLQEAVGAWSMNAGYDWDVSTFMTNKSILTPRDKEIQTLFARGKAPEIIAIRLGIKISKVLLAIAMVPKALI
jgi:DNA-binding NarL/FixJ family response regulator